MVESEAEELSEEIMLGAVNFGHQHMQPVIDAIIELAEVAAKEPRDLPVEAPEAAAMRDMLAGLAGKLAAAYEIADKSARQEALAEARAEASELAGEDADGVLVSSIVKEMEADIGTKFFAHKSELCGRGFRLRCKLKVVRFCCHFNGNGFVWQWDVD